MRVVTHDKGEFRHLTDTKVLIYWPHGFGDWVFLSYLLPLLTPSNQYWVTRFGDDSSALFEKSQYATPAYIGLSSPVHGNGELFGSPHFGLRYEEIDGSEATVHLPLALYDLCRQEQITTLLWSSHPEAYGFTAFPFHTKARRLLPFLVADERLAATDLGQALPTAINWSVERWLMRWVEARLRRFGFGERKLCLIARTGYTSVIKNWGHYWREDLPVSKQHEGEECRDFMRLMLRKDPRWLFLFMEDQFFQDADSMRNEELQAYSYAQLFGTVGATALPFGMVTKALVGLASLCVGVPTGPYHLSMAHPNVPTVGLWISHLPWWYDEPKPASVHLISRHVEDLEYESRPGNATAIAHHSFEVRRLESRIISGESVFEAVETLL